jgi:Wall-associated receptor kinase galacturonan-binding
MLETVMAIIVIPLLQILVLVLASNISESAANVSLPGCPDSCGGTAIPYPFGIGPNCSMAMEYRLYSSGFEIFCNTTKNSKHIPYLMLNDDYWEILNISLNLGQIRVISSPISSQCYNTTSQGQDLMLRL